MTGADDDLRRQAETAASLLTAAPEDAEPGTRLGRQTLLSGDERERLSEALRPLPVGRTDDAGVDLAIIGRLGQGGMAYVELAKQHSLDREVALKRPKGGPDDHEVTAPALVDEARITGALEHPNIVPVHAVGRDAALGPVVVLKRVQGAVWSDVLERDRPRMHEDPAVLDQHLRILMQVSNALHYAHSRGVIHRDVKPSNVMLGDYGEVYLMDWGVALKRRDESSQAASVAGTAAYMAPEMVHKKNVGAPADLYGMGLIFAEMLTGSKIVDIDNVYDTILFQASKKPVKLDPALKSGTFYKVIKRSVAKPMGKRYPDASTFMSELDCFNGNFIAFCF